MTTRLRSGLVLFVSMSLVVPFLGLRIALAKKQPKITMKIGRPNIWSLGQAHYLLANMRNTNRGLRVQSPGDLNPNSINGARMEVLRTLLGIEAQVSTPQSFQNSVAQQQFQADFARKQSAIARLDELSREQLRVVREITDIDIELAKLGSQPAADKQVKETELKREELTKQKDAKEVLRTTIAAQITTVTTQATAPVTLSNLQNAMPFGTPSPPTLPAEGIGDIKDLINKMLTGQPDADASQKLDNYIDMQYEVIAKQLTLLRDEVGPNERLIFLELPASLYTVPGTDDDQIVQIEWTIAEFLEQCDKTATGTVQGYVNRRNAEVLKNALLAARAWPTSVSADTIKRVLEDADQSPGADLQEVVNRVLATGVGNTASDLASRGIPRETRQAPPITDEFLARFFELNKTYRNLIVHFIYADAYRTLERAKKKLSSRRTRVDTQKSVVESRKSAISDDARRKQADYETTVATKDSQELKLQEGELEKTIESLKTYFKDAEFGREIAKVNQVIDDDHEFAKLYGQKLPNFTKISPLEQFEKLIALPELDWQNIEELKDMVVAYPQLLWMGWTATANTNSKQAEATATTQQTKHHSTPQASSSPKPTPTPTADPPRPARCVVESSDPAAKVRVIDIVPRRSALNINDVHATQKGFALAAKFLTLFGFGAQVNYQRQRSIYEQFINEDVFASGFGKGTDSFGWTIGPLPGTKRLAPGPRTTFAILAIPSDAWKISLKATAVAFPRTKSPSHDADSRFHLTPDAKAVTFDLLIPGEDTEGFWADRISYTPVQKGQRVTAIIGGRYFSPLTGVMVDGVPLKRVVAIAKHESDSSTLPLAADSPGEYEYLNPSQIIISFKTSDANFVGTPLITLVTPERTSSINFFRDMRINRTYTDSLQHHSLIEPMFLDTFNFAGVEVKRDDLLGVPVGSPISIRLRGSGFRRRAQICVNENCDTNPQLKNTGVYEITVPMPVEQVWNITYRLGQDVASRTFSTIVDALRPDSPTIESIENPTTGKAEGLLAGGYTVIIRGNNLHRVNKVFFGDTDVKVVPAHPNVLLVKVPAGGEGAVRVLMTGKLETVEVSNILDFTTPGKAIFRYVKPPDKPADQPNPPAPPKKKNKKKTGKKAR